MTLPTSALQLLNTFNASTSWEQRMRSIMQAGDHLAPLDKEQQIESNQIQGCESQVWLVAKQYNNQWQFKAYSEARLIRGLLAIALTRVNNLTAEEIQVIDLEDWFNQLGLSRQLSSSRRDGLKAIFSRIKSVG